MASQPAITDFFASRKRPATDEVKRSLQPNKKVMILENDEGDVSIRKIVDDKQKTALAARRRLQLDIRKTFGVLNGKTKSFVTDKDSKSTDHTNKETNFEKAKEKSNKSNLEKAKEKPDKSNLEKLKEKSNKSNLEKAKEKPDKSNLEKVKEKPNKSSRITDLKAALARLNDGFKKLDRIQQEKKILSEEKPKIEKFETITFEATVPASPSKTPVKQVIGMSPAKLREAVFRSPGQKLNMEPVYVSPRKLFDTAPSVSTPLSPLKSPVKSPAFERYQALVTEGKATLTLPFKYRSLAEVFRAVDTIVSMMENRRETVTFSKLKFAVQEMLRRNLYEKHLGQIKAVCESAYCFQYEKVLSMGSKMQPEKQELVIKPILQDKIVKSTDENGETQETVTKSGMTPDILLARRRLFYNTLLEKTKDYHEKFLATLDPPLVVPRNSLTRWHPEFDVDGVPDIESASLPVPPNVTKVSTARDVLEKARNLFNSNPRMERALQKVSEQNGSTSENPLQIPAGNTGPAVAALTNALKGIPKSLLEKVRARQAAKAMEAMTRSPFQAKEAIRLTRLPEIARIVRNTFISEKKSVLTRELIIKKLSDSYRENLGFQELDSHLNLLQEKTPEWLSFCTLRKTDYVKFVKDASMAEVMAKLENLAALNSI